MGRWVNDSPAPLPTLRLLDPPSPSIGGERWWWAEGSSLPKAGGRCGGGGFEAAGRRLCCRPLGGVGWGPRCLWGSERIRGGKAAGRASLRRRCAITASSRRTVRRRWYPRADILPLQRGCWVAGVVGCARRGSVWEGDYVNYEAVGRPAVLVGIVLSVYASSGIAASMRSIPTTAAREIPVPCMPERETRRKSSDIPSSAATRRMSSRGQ